MQRQYQYNDNTNQYLTDRQSDAHVASAKLKRSLKRLAETVGGPIAKKKCRRNTGKHALALSNASEFKSPMSTGDSQGRWPLRKEHWQAVLDECRSSWRNDVLYELSTIAPETVEALEVNYYPQRAAVVLNNARMSKTFSPDTTCPSFSTAVRLAPGLPNRSCWEEHPQLCKKDHSDIHAAVLEFEKRLNGFVRSQPESDRYKTMLGFRFKGRDAEEDAHNYMTFFWLGGGTLMSGAQLQVYFAVECQEFEPLPASANQKCRVHAIPPVHERPPLHLHMLEGKSKRLGLAKPAMVFTCGLGVELANQGVCRLDEIIIMHVEIEDLSRGRFVTLTSEFPVISTEAPVDDAAAAGGAGADDGAAGDGGGGPGGGHGAGPDGGPGGGHGPVSQAALDQAFARNIAKLRSAGAAHERVKAAKKLAEKATDASDDLKKAALKEFFSAWDDDQESNASSSSINSDSTPSDSDGSEHGGGVAKAKAKAKSSAKAKASGGGGAAPKPPHGHVDKGADKEKSTCR